MKNGLRLGRLLIDWRLGLAWRRDRNGMPWITELVSWSDLLYFALTSVMLIIWLWLYYA